MASQVYECQIYRPSLRRAEKKVPPEFHEGYRWFQDHTDVHIAQLPYGQGQPSGVSIPLARQSGIYSPSKDRVTYKNPDVRYALSVHTSDKATYADRQKIDLPDGSWIFEYAAHRGSADEQGYNELLLRCLRDGIPVGVMVAEKPGYRVLGLAFVERYNSATGFFTLHGPVLVQTETANTFVYPGLADVPEKELEALDVSDDLRKKEHVLQVRREKQEEFRKSLFEAYRGHCAITDVAVKEVLQAAHIIPYRGVHTQTPTNGLLLRADFHLLYDSHLLSIEPVSHTIELSKRLRETSYQSYAGRTIRLPERRDLFPCESSLAVHFKQFEVENAGVGFL